jgi:hypothetical protein
MEDSRDTEARVRQPDDGKDHGVSRLTRGLRRLSGATAAAARGDATWTSVIDMALEASAGIKRKSRKYAVSCLMDGKPKFQEQTLSWVAALRMCDAPGAMELFVHYTRPQPQALLDQLQSIGVNLVEVNRFGGGPAVYCNKLQQLQTFEGSDFDEIILTDTDVAFLKSPMSLFGTGCVRAKVVDMPNPPADVLAELLRRAGFDKAFLTAQPDFSSDARTHRYNCNGGFYALPGSIAPDLGRRWVAWSRFCLQQTDLLGKKIIHSDQLGFMLAMIEGRFKFKALPLTANFPTHFGADSYRELGKDEITALHYHDKVDANGALLPTGNAAVDRAIQAANTQISKGRAELGIDASRLLAA